MHSTQIEGKFVVTERFIRTLENKIYMTLISKNVYLEKLNYIVDKYNKTYHRTTKMKSIDVKDSTIFISILKAMTKILNLQLVNM